MDKHRIESVSFAGSGNVASNLAPALRKAGYHIRDIWSRDSKNAERLALATGARPVESFNALDGSVDLLLIALPDSVIPEFAGRITGSVHFTGIIAHTSGSLSLKSLQDVHTASGVFYPLQSFTRHTHPDVSAVPFCIEGSTDEIAGRLSAVAKSLSPDVRLIDSRQRLQIHLAAVFASNFTNYLYSVSETLLQNAGVEPDILLPLIRETAGRLQSGSAVNFQTGPAIRGDLSTIETHLKLLSNDPSLASIYRLLSDGIVKMKANIT